MYRKPTKTEYKGTVYRSKTEAIFARCLDLAGLEYQYEPSCDGAVYFNENDPEPDYNNGIPYTPDFIVSVGQFPYDRNLLIEVKPSVPSETYLNNLHNKLFEETKGMRFGLGYYGNKLRVDTLMDAFDHTYGLNSFAIAVFNPFDGEFSIIYTDDLNPSLSKPGSYTVIDCPNDAYGTRAGGELYSAMSRMDEAKQYRFDLAEADNSDRAGNSMISKILRRDRLKNCHDVVISEAVHKITKKGNGNYLSVEFNAISCIFADHRKWVINLNLVNPNPLAVDIAKKDLASMCKAVGLSKIEHEDQLIGKRLSIKVDGSNVKGFYPLAVRVPPPPQAPVASCAPKEMPW